jgi:hypothetical protein
MGNILLKVLTDPTIRDADSMEASIICRPASSPWS